MAVGLLATAVTGRSQILVARGRDLAVTATPRTASLEAEEGLSVNVLEGT